MDYDKLRQIMVETQLVPRGIADQRVLDAFRAVPRHLFVPEHLRASAYDDCALPIGEGQTISQPYMAAVMTEKLAPTGAEKVLEIGTGSGYQTAILAVLSKTVYTMERLAALSRQAENNLKAAGYSNVQFKTGDGTQGLPEAAPYDAIIVTAGCPSIPTPLLEQLKNQGRLVLPLGNRFQQVLTTVAKQKDELKLEESVACVFVPLVGKFGWPR